MSKTVNNTNIRYAYIFILIPVSQNAYCSDMSGVFWVMGLLALFPFLIIGPIFVLIGLTVSANSSLINDKTGAVLGAALGYAVSYLLIYLIGN